MQEARDRVKQMEDELERQLMLFRQISSLYDIVAELDAKRITASHQQGTYPEKSRFCTMAFLDYHVVNTVHRLERG